MSEPLIRETPQFLFFWHGWPSQWHPSRFELDGVTYNCCEQFMMAEKSRVFGDAETLSSVLRAETPKEQKALGRQVRNFDSAVWTDVCRGIVFTGNLAKFRQNADLADLLLATGDRQMVEASPFDRIWGIGLAADHPNATEPTRWRGTNWLGIALDQVRAVLRAEREGREPRAPEQWLAEHLKRREEIARSMASD